MQYQELKPDWPLNLFVECFWTLEAEHRAASGPERILPDGCAEIILNFGDRFQQHKAGTIEVQPRFFLVGQITGPLSISSTGIVKLIGIRFHPGGTRPFLKLPMHEITNQYVNLDEIPEYFPPEWIKPLEDAPSLAAAIKKLESVLLSKIQRTTADLSSLELARRFIQERGLVSVDEIADEAGMQHSSTRAEVSSRRGYWTESSRENFKVSASVSGHFARESILGASCGGVRILRPGSPHTGLP